MAISTNNEITVRATCTYEELDKQLKDKGFEAINQYRTTDIFMIPKDIDIYKEKTREILSKAILLRDANGITTNRNSKKITYKIKNIDEEGNIISQSSIKCKIENIEDAKEIFLAIGYKELMKISELHTTYQKNKLNFIVKEIESNNILIEIETNEIYKDIEELKNIVISLKLPIDLSNFFVKKAEEELDKIKNNVGS